MFYQRHTTALFIPTLLFCFACCALTRNRIYVRVIICLMLVFNSVALWQIYSKLAKPGDWRRVAAYIASREENQPRQPILVFHGGSARLLRVYYADGKQIVGVPREEEFERFDARDFVLEDERQITDALNRAGAPNASNSLDESNVERFWLVTDNQCSYLSVKYNCEKLERFVSERYETQSRREFYGSTVRLLLRRK